MKGNNQKHTRRKRRNQVSKPALPLAADVSRPWVVVVRVRGEGVGGGKNNLAAAFFGFVWPLSVSFVFFFGDFVWTAEKKKRRSQRRWRLRGGEAKN